jgi:micrococcal nuclease
MVQMIFPTATLHLTALALSVWFVLPWSIQAADFTSHVVGITDGDTITVLNQGVEERIQLNGIDCPEKGQPYGRNAKRFTSFLVFGRRVIVRSVGKDHQGRILADVIMENGRILNQELVKEGLAWYRQDSTDETLGKLEGRARLEKRGLWSEESAIPPWEWRKSLKRDLVTPARGRR